MRRAAALVRTTVGLKAGMAVSGLLFFGFVVGHMVGNLKAFQGAEYFNHYAEGLRTIGAPFFGRGQLLWLARLGLLAALVLHVWAATVLTIRSRRARPVAYRQTPHLETTYASRTMRVGGILLFVFVIYHLMHFTWGSAHPHFIPGDAYYNVVVGFQSPWVVMVYVAAQVFLAMHLYHGLWSALQSLGANHPAYDRWRRPAAALLAGAIFVGFCSVPFAVQAGVIHL